MIVFVLAVLHLYMGVRLFAPLPLPLALTGTAGLAALFALLLASLARGFGRRMPVDGLAWAGLISIGLFSSLFVLTVARDALLLAAAAVHSLGGPALPTAALQGSALAVPALAIGATVWGFFNARRRPALRRVEVPIDGLPAPLHGFRIVQISDLHVGPTIRRPFVDAVVDAANGLEADLAAVTGDVVDGRVDDLSPHTAPLGRLRARHGVFAVTGNHEYYSGAAPWIAEFERLGMRVLMNEHVVLRRGEAALVVAGVPDASAHRFDADHRADPARALHGAPPDAVRLLLAHQPRSAEAAARAGFQLQLSGHTHGGQFLPWNWFVPLQQPYTAGLHRHGRMWVYTSRGTGYWGPPKRLGAPSEITLLTLVPA